MHPRNLGGEFLPDANADEVEIVRIELASVTGDICQVRALRRREDRIHFRVVDEYWHEGVTYRVSPETSDQPLTLAELIDLIDTSEREEEAHPGGLVDSHLEFLLHEEAWIEGPTEIAAFATVTSAFYPMLNEYFLARAEAWLADVEAERQAEREDEEHELLEDYRQQLDGLAESATWTGPANELPEDLYEQAGVLLVEGHLDRAEMICDELGESADDLRVMIAIKRGDIDDAIRLARKIGGT
ncbi:MAG TPA: hypothetical protein VNB06_08430 [Thermoanaerobaculia bacterium]|nr:hypothetical protein [Thermoanaerobaculia bacterium]